MQVIFQKRRVTFIRLKETERWQFKDITVRMYQAGHAFINPDHGDYVKEAAEDAWPRAVNFLKEHLK